MSKHTPGPWIWSPEYRGLFGAGEFNAVLDYAYTENMWLSQGNKEANARLIAAAPDLLAALIYLVDQLVAADEEGLIEHAAPMTAARAAILKATGGAS